MSDSGDSSKTEKKKEYNRNAQRLFRQRRKEHLKNLERAERELAMTHAEEVERLRREINELRLENENLRLRQLSPRSSPAPVHPIPSSPSSSSYAAGSPLPSFEMYGVSSSQYTRLSHANSFTSSNPSDRTATLCVLFPRDIAEVRRDLHERLAPVLDLSVVTDPQRHLTTLAALAPSLSAALQPTFLQLRTPHHAYIDLIPSPSLRDRLIRTDPDTANAFLTEVCTFVYETEDRGQLTIWGDDHLSEFAWEFSAEVLEKWGGILTEEWRERANFWRRQRDAPLL
ncbi:hypothetical protein VTN77DRAFT_9250 [Rasamsonia byssochlamydoides]|uniref:uncharacterized protein n=1 Tax=Rasamsonia byssochlamydoides TaxID=89139 RepID=UPI003742E466